MLLYWLLVALSALAPAVSRSAAVCSDTECEKLDDRNDPYYYDLLETALLNDSSNLYELQRALFPTSRDPRVAKKVHVYLNLVVNRLEDDLCGSGGGKTTFSEYRWYHNGWYTWHAQVQDESSLDAIVGRVLSSARMYEGIILLAEVFSALLSQQYFDEPNCQSACAHLTIRLDYLKCNPDEDDTEYVARYLLSWVGKVDHL